MSGELVLVTGGSGFVGAHCILRLLNDGYRVRTTVRNTVREEELRALLRDAGAELGRRLSVTLADLRRDEGWPEAVHDCDFVLHVASPFPAAEPRNENDLIIPAREGALRVLRAASRARVKRVVMTSSFAAIGYGQAARDTPFTEADWTDVDGEGVRAYTKSKTLAERAAWDFMRREGGRTELAVINPVMILGPVLGKQYSTSIRLIEMLMKGIPVTPRNALGIVDVRDVADLHIRAMLSPSAAGQRFIATAGRFMWIKEIAKVLRDRMGEAGRRAPQLELPDWVVKAGATVSSSVAQFAAELGHMKKASSDKARTMLGWGPQSNEDAIVATAESLIRVGVIQPPIEVPTQYR